MAFERLLQSRKRIDVLALPTGVGKSLVNMTFAILNGYRMVYLTSTKALQDQLMADFAEVGLVDIRGMGNYQCLDLKPRHVMADNGPCLDGYRCPIRENGCPYFDQHRLASGSQLVVTNYAKWLTQARNGEGLGQRDLLVLDEGHEAINEVTDFLRLEFGWHEVKPPARTLQSMTLGEWREWAEVRSPSIMAQLAEAVPGTGRARELRDLLKRLRWLSQATGEWVWEEQNDGVTLEPLWPGALAEEMLFRRIPRIVISSATIRAEQLRHLGLKPGDFNYHEGYSPFPVADRPVIWVPTLKLNSKSTTEDMLMWVERIDQIVGRRLDRKGLVHTVNYDRARFLQQHTRYRDLLIFPESRNTRQKLKEFNERTGAAVFVSPAIHTGYDFPDERAEYQIVGKIPFVDHRGAIMSRRLELDSSYGDELALTKLVQIAGRCKRTMRDRCETLIIDDAIQYLMKRRGHVTPAWFREAYREARVIPPPLPKLEAA